jgi:hypothetical protein
MGQEMDSPRSNDDRWQQPPDNPDTGTEAEQQ